jgi:RNA-directed DNA polymerase
MGHTHLKAIIVLQGLKSRPIDGISKKVVLEACQKVKATKGVAGLDGQSLAVFVVNLKDNLSKIWNRMSSGSYFPPAVKKVKLG